MKVDLNDPIFKKIARITQSNQIPAYVVGGFVRDIFLNRPSKDIDVVVLGDGISLAKQLAAQTPHSNFAFFTARPWLKPTIGK